MPVSRDPAGRSTLAVRPGPGQESVWDYPRPPRLEATPRRVRVVLGDVTIADTVRALRVLETSHPPTYYIPSADVRRDCLEVVPGVGSICEWKGAARYFNITTGARRALRAAWSYPAPTATFAALKDHLAFYVAAMDACYLDDEQAHARRRHPVGGAPSNEACGVRAGPAHLFNCLDAC